MLASSRPIWYPQSIALLRIVTGLLMAYHGWEVFDRATMEGYFGWDVLKNMPAPEFLIYLGKATELVGGILLALGLFTRIAALMIIGVMSFICFVVGGGKFWYQDQHPFLFVMLALVFFFTGPLTWSLDQRLFKSKS